MKNLAEWIFTEDADMEKKVLSTFSGDYSLSDIEKGMNEFIALLEKEGNLKGKKVALLVPQIPSYLKLVLAINKLGGILVPLSYQLRNDDLTAILDFLEPHIVLTVESNNDFNFYETIKLWASDRNKRMVIISSVNGEEWNNRIEIRGEEQPPEKDPIDIIAFTTGSTGLPKGIMFNADYLVDSHKKLVQCLRVRKEDKVFQNMNPSWILGLAWLFTGLKEQCLLISPETFDVPKVVQMFKEKKPTKVSTTPSLLRTIYGFAQKMKAMDGFRELELCNVSGEMIPVDLMATLSELQHCRVESVFGASETGGLMYTPNDIRESMEWDVFDNVDFKIVDGEIFFKCENQFIGYYKRPDLTKEVLTEDGWYISGDLAALNQGNKIEILGRKKDLIKKGGQQIIPGEIERVLSEHPSVGQVIVVGIPHPSLGEKVVAFIIKNDDDVTAQDLKRYCTKRIAAYKIPDDYKFIGQIPTINGKADKGRLRNMA